MSDFELIRIKEAAQILEVSVQTVRNMIDRGVFTGARKIDPSRRNSPYRIPRAEVLAVKTNRKYHNFASAAAQAATLSIGIKRLFGARAIEDIQDRATQEEIEKAKKS